MSKEIVPCLFKVDHICPVDCPLHESILENNLPGATKSIYDYFKSAPQEEVDEVEMFGWDNSYDYISSCALYNPKSRLPLF